MESVLSNIFEVSLQFISFVCAKNKHTASVMVTVQHLICILALQEEVY